jgi:hypothetical protein
MIVIYKNTYPNGEIYVGRDRLTASIFAARTAV